MNRLIDTINLTTLDVHKANIRIEEAANSMREFGDKVAAVRPYLRAIMYLSSYWDEIKPKLISK